MPRVCRRLLIVTLLIGMLLGIVAGPANPAGAAGGSGIRTFVLPWTGVSQGAPAISGQLVVWASDHKPYENLAVTDLSTGRTTPVVSGGTAITPPFGPPSPALDGHLVVWMDCRVCSHQAGADQMFPEGTRIYARDLASRHTFAVAPSADAQTFAAASQGWIVWTEQQAGHRHIFARNPATGRVFRLSGSVGDQVAPSISWPIVVWQDLRIARASNVGDYLEDPLISGQTVIWTHWRTDGSISIDGTDLATGRAFQVVHLQAGQFNPQLGVHAAMDGNLVAWDQARRTPYVPGDSDIYVRNLATGQTLQLTHDAAGHAWPAISGHTVVWQQRLAGKSRIAGAVLP